MRMYEIGEVLVFVNDLGHLSGSGGGLSHAKTCIVVMTLHVGLTATNNTN